LCRARAHKSGLSPKHRKQKQHGARARPRSRPRGVPHPSEETRSVSSLSADGLRAAAAARDCPARCPARAGVAEVRLLRPPPRVGVRDAHHRALALLDFIPTTVANEHRFPSHVSPPHGAISRKPYRKPGPSMRPRVIAGAWNATDCTSPALPVSAPPRVP